MGILSGLDDFTGWALLQKNSAAIAKSYTAGTSSAADISYLKSVLPTLRTPQQLLNNYRALSIVTTAYGLGAEVGQTAILGKLMTQDPHASTSLAQQLADNRYLSFAQAMSTHQPAALFSSSSIANITAAFALQAPGGTATAAEVAFFEAVAPTLTTPAQLLASPQAVSFITTAFGVGNLASQPSVLNNLLTQDPTASTSVAQQSGNSSYLALANALYTFKALPSSTPAGINAIVAGYQQNSFEAAVGKDNPALQEASYFSRVAVGATNLTQLMADPALLNVVRVAEGLPVAFGNLSYDQQVAILQPRVDMKQFATPAGVANFVTKYLAMDQLNGTTNSTTTGAAGGTANSSSNPLLTLFNSSSNSGGNGSGSGTTDITSSLITPGSLNLVL